MRRVPYGSRDVRHVPPVNPENLWPFGEGQERLIGVFGGGRTLLSFRVDRIGTTWIEGLQVMGEQKIPGELHLDRPVVIARNAITRAPEVTLTLRKIEGGQAFLQVTVDPSIPFRAQSAAG